MQNPVIYISDSPLPLPSSTTRDLNLWWSIFSSFFNFQRVDVAPPLYLLTLVFCTFVHCECCVNNVFEKYRPPTPLQPVTNTEHAVYRGYFVIIFTLARLSWGLHVAFLVGQRFFITFIKKIYFPPMCICVCVCVRASVSYTHLTLPTRRTV